MKLIQKLCEMIDEEIGDADKYAKLALKYKEERPTLAKTFYDLSTDELRHMKLLHDQVVTVIEEYRKEKGEPPASMMAVYEYLHEKQIERSNAVMTAWNTYRNG